MLNSAKTAHNNLTRRSP